MNGEEDSPNNSYLNLTPRRHRSRSRPSTPKSLASKHGKVSPGRPVCVTDSPSSSPARDDFTKRQKVLAIGRVLKTEPVDVGTLKQFCISRGGLLSDDIRKKTWHKLLSADVENILQKPDEETLHGHRDYQQVVMDVNRSLKRFPPGMEVDVRMAMQDQLVDCIMRTLVHHEDLHYYQGFHDIVVTFLLVVGEDVTFALMDKLCRNHLRDFMGKTMEKTTTILNYLYPIIGRASPELRAFMEKAETGTIFSLSWLITWYGHVLNDFTDIVRLYDFFIACHPLMPIYLAAAIVLYREDAVLAVECEMPYIHSLLSRIPDDLPFEMLIARAGDLFIQFPPEKLQLEAELEAHKAKLALEKAKENGSSSLHHGTTHKSAGQRRNMRLLPQNGSLLVRVTVVTLMGALSAAAYVILCSGSNWDNKWPWWGS